jgi:hypothetical protein
MSRRQTFALFVLTSSALLMTGASAQQPAPQGSSLADPAVVCPRDGPGTPGMGHGMGPGTGRGPMAGQPGGMMMHQEDVRGMHTEMTALREEIRLLREELRTRR